MLITQANILVRATNVSMEELLLAVHSDTQNCRSQQPLLFWTLVLQRRL